MKKTITLIFLCLILIVTSGISQSKKKKKKTDEEEYPLTAMMGDEEVRYKVMVDKPEDHSNLFIGLDYCGLDMGPVTAGLGLGLDAKYIQNKYMLNGNLYYGILNIPNLLNRDKMLKLSPFFHIEGGGTYYFLIKEKNRNRYLPLESHTVQTVDMNTGLMKNTTGTKGIKIPSRFIRKFGFRTGYFYQQNPDGFTGESLEYNNKIRTSKIAINSFYAGLSILKFRNITIKAKGFGDASSSGITHMYFDILGASSISGTFYSTGSYGVYDEVKYDKFTKNHLG